MVTVEDLNRRSSGHFPAFLGIRVTHVEPGEVRAELAVTSSLMAPNGFLHAAAVVALADTACGYGCIASLPEGAAGFTTVELKSNHLGTARSGIIECVARATHLGRSTQVWDAVVTSRETGKRIALFRCTQMILQPA
ncbi:MAG: PaaI family thioesterase [Rhodospirillaceae bacterium]